ncbi:MAG: hypothetical protein EFT35_05115 [Methanophagales archaeon ANME-1-THS]|nr:MAG: hypothetical protein EFT35_05115 [Methanophagales archaeon ANME-1-THS]
MADISPVSPNPDELAYIRFFRATNTSGSKAVQFLKGDGSTTVSAEIRCGESSSIKADSFVGNIHKYDPAYVEEWNGLQNISDCQFNSTWVGSFGNGATWKFFYGNFTNCPNLTLNQTGPGYNLTDPRGLAIVNSQYSYWRTFGGGGNAISVGYTITSSNSADVVTLGTTTSFNKVWGNITLYLRPNDRIYFWGYGNINDEPNIGDRILNVVGMVGYGKINASSIGATKEFRGIVDVPPNYSLVATFYNITKNVTEGDIFPIGPSQIVISGHNSTLGSPMFLMYNGS